MSAGVLLLDYDQDGWLDIYFTNAPTVEMALRGEKARSALYHNNHDGTFTDVTDKAGVGYPCWAMGGAVADYNNDGWPDILVTCVGHNVLYRNNGDGTFTDVSARSGIAAHEGWSTAAAWGDYDADGFVDLFITRYVDFDLQHLPAFGSTPTCRFRGIAVQCGPRGLKGDTDSLYHNNGNGTFTEISHQAGVDGESRYYGLGAVWSDFKGDGRQHLFVANDSTPNYLYENIGNGKFKDVSFAAGVAVNADGGEQASMGIGLCDYLHTGLPSIFVTTFEDQYKTLFHNDGNLTFTDVTYAAHLAAPTIPYLGWGIGCQDFDNDGWPDIFFVNGHVYPQVDGMEIGARYREGKLLFMNQHDGTFRDATKESGAALMIPQPSRGAAFGDLDNDGDIDVVVENIDGAPMILRNDGGNRQHWITLQLTGTRSNRLAIGARVKVRAGGITQTDEVRTGGSYLSQNDLRLHFGLGAATNVDSVEVRWPNGEVEVLKAIDADSFYRITEGKGLTVLQR